MKMIFSGTSDAKEYVINLAKKEKVLVSTFTEYGKNLYDGYENIIARYGKMDEEEKIRLIKEHNIDEIIDYTHPYAKNISKSLIDLCKKIDLKYTRIDRKAFLDEIKREDIIGFDSYEEIVEYLNGTEGNILLTIGSNNLEAFNSLDDIDRVYSRVLPTVDSIKKCNEANINPNRVIAIWGPFSYNYNRLLIQEYNIKYLVTKDSGIVGGVKEKIDAAIKEGIIVIFLKRM